KLAPLQILLDQIDSELLPFALAEHAVVVAAGVVLREVVGDRTGHAVIAHDAKRQQAVAVTVFMLCQIVPVELAISRARVALEDVHVLLVESRHGVLPACPKIGRSADAVLREQLASALLDSFPVLQEYA